MFTGIIRSIGSVAACERSKGGGARLQIKCPAGMLAQCARGDSIAVNGCCLSLVSRRGRQAHFDMAPETLARTAPLRAGDAVHLETSLRAGDLIGGHLMFGHVDGTAAVASAQKRGSCLRIGLTAPAGCARLLAPKGSVAIAGVSLTVASCSGRRFEVELIPQTLADTWLARLKPGDSVNFEADMLARYAAGQRKQPARR